MATNVSHNLMRSIQRGTVRTAAREQGAAPTGVFTEEEGPADGQMASLGGLAVASSRAAASESNADAIFDQLFSQAPSAASKLAQPAEEIVPDLMPPPEAAVAPAPPSRVGGLSRAERFREVAAPAPAKPPAPAPEAKAGPLRSWSRFVDPDMKPEARDIRKSMAAAKVLTPLVAAVSFAPGNASAGADKSKSLQEMLVGVHRCAVSTAEAISESMQKDVPSWMVTQLMQSMSQAVSRRWEHGQGADMDALAANMKSLFGAHGPEIDSLVQGASEDAYVEVNHPDIARFRISVSAANAAWTLFDWVTHPRLSLDDKGDMPSRFFTFNQAPSVLVNKMLVRCVNECRALVAQVESTDLRTAHMQSSIARMSNLIGAEYVTRTRHVMNWIGDQAITDEEYQDRLDASVRELDTRMLPEIYEYARVTFLRVEQSSFRTIEDLNEKTNSQLVPDGDSRPAVS